MDADGDNVMVGGISAVKSGGGHTDNKEPIKISPL
jgi:hypothetical protein